MHPWCKNSLTIAWARFLMVAGVAVEVLSPVMAAYLPFAPPKYVGLYTVAVALVTELARRRTLAKE